MGLGARAVSSSPVRIALAYVLAGTAWILFSDQLLHLLVPDSTVETYVQPVKGLAFVAASAAVLYLLIARSRRELERTNDRLDLAVQQTSILHRLLRHNLRNSCNVIYGNTQLLDERQATDADGDGRRLDLVEERRDPVTAIEAEVESLLQISEKTRLLRNVVLVDSTTVQPVDIAVAARSRVAATRERYPEATIRTDLPSTALAETHPDIDVALDELLENAIVHHDGQSPTIRVSIEAFDEPSATAGGGGLDRPSVGTDSDLSRGGVRLEIADDGPGIPEMERAVLDARVERQTFHSIGLGLWLAQTLVTETGGDLEIDSSDAGGTVVRIRLPGPSS